jgi:TetR/AcrR family transcriptional regulator, regulator of cefoperazone and chloramphenicol sensitivity
MARSVGARKTPRERRPSRDADTRQRLLAAAETLFGARGYANVTVRDLCREAAANIAAVNYHFGDKLGLYRELIQGALDQVRSGDVTIMAPAGSTAEEKLRHYVRAFVPRVARPEARTAAIQRIMQHEMLEPTPLAPWIASQVILPRIDYLAAVITELLGEAANHETVRRCVYSLHAQCVFYMPHRIRDIVFPELREATRREVEEVADHIIEFSLAGIRGIVSARRGGGPRERIP